MGSLFVWALLPDGDVTLQPGESALVPIGLHLSVDPGYIVNVVSLPLRDAPSFLVVACDTEGDAHVVLWNHTSAPTTISNGTVVGRIQAHGVARVSVVEVP